MTKQGSPEFVPVAERIAVFDNDGTLWAEQPMYFQFLFALDRVKALAPQHPEWKDKEPFASLLEGRRQRTRSPAASRPSLEIIVATHAGMTTDEFDKIVKDWIATAKHPKTKRPYTQMVYQPMLEVLAYLRAQRVQDLHRLRRRRRVHAALAEKVYGIPPEQVVGSSGKIKFEMRDGKPVLVKLPEIEFIDDKDGQAGRHPATHRPPADRGIRQLRRRPADAAMDGRRQRPALLP